jgi:hypothetical protein
MIQRSVKLFVYSSCALFLLTASAKLISANGTAKILDTLDPIFLISFRHVMCVAAVLELCVALICFFGARLILQIGLIAILATNFMLYRLGLYWMGYSGAVCPCFGTLTSALHIPPHVASIAMEIILAYLLAGSYAALFWLWRQKRQVQLAQPLSGSPVSAA